MYDAWNQKQIRFLLIFFDQNILWSVMVFSSLIFSVCLRLRYMCNNKIFLLWLTVTVYITNKKYIKNESMKRDIVGDSSSHNYTSIILNMDYAWLGTFLIFDLYNNSNAIRRCVEPCLCTKLCGYRRTVDVINKSTWK